jgi:hypothetical protein
MIQILAGIFNTPVSAGHVNECVRLWGPILNVRIHSARFLSNQGICKLDSRNQKACFFLVEKSKGLLTMAASSHMFRP